MLEVRVASRFPECVLLLKEGSRDTDLSKSLVFFMFLYYLLLS